MLTHRYVLGIDFGSDSVRALIVDARTGSEIDSAVAEYSRWSQGRYSDPTENRFRQHPQDYIEALVKCVTALKPDARKEILGIGISATGSTPCPVDKFGRPLALLPEFEENPNAMFVLWKDHTAKGESAEIHALCKDWGGSDYTKYVGGACSPEWFFPKILHISRTDDAVRTKAHSWVELADWIPALLTDTIDPAKIRRGRSGASHKNMWNQEWDGLPAEEFLVKLDPSLAGLRDRLYTETFTSDQKAGDLTEQWAEKLGLSPGIPIAVGCLDCHSGAVGGGIREGVMVKVVGTSSCDLLVAPYETIGERVVEGIFGQGDGSIIPGMWGFEAGQSAFGDAYAWFKNLLSWPLKALGEDYGISTTDRLSLESAILNKLTDEAWQIEDSNQTLLTLDWLNGRRTPWTDPNLKGAILGLTLGSDAPRLFRSLIEATLFGSKAILEEFKKWDFQIDEVIALGGIPDKNPLVLRIMADVFNIRVKTAESDQAVALGAAMFGSVVAGLFPDIIEAQKAMASGIRDIVDPIPVNVEKYEIMYRKYCQAGEAIGEILREL